MAVSPKNALPFWVRGTAWVTLVSFTYVNVLYGAVEPARNLWQERRAVVQGMRQEGGPETPTQVPQPAPDNPLLAQLPSINPDLLDPSISASSLDRRSEAILHQYGQGVQAAIPSWMKRIPFGYVNLKDLYLPSGWKPGDFLVVHIQDAHQNYEAQKNIAKVIEALAAQPADPKSPPESGLSTEANPALIVGLEGARGAFNFLPYRTFPDPAVTRQVADYLLKESYITGPEYIGMTAARLPTYWGVEDEKLYLEHVRAYLDSSKRDPEAKELQEELERKVAGLKPRIFNDRLLDLDREMAGFHQGRLGLGNYLAYLGGQAAGPNVRMFLEALALERVLKSEDVERERRELTARLAQSLPKKELENLANAGLAYRAGNLTHGTFYRYLENLCQTYRVPLSRYPGMEKYIRYVMISDRIKAEDLFAEIQRLERQRIRELAVTKDEKEGVSLSQDLVTIEKIFGYGISSDEWRDYLAREAEIANLPARINRLAAVAVSEKQQARLRELLEAYGRFSAAALARNASLVDNLLAKAKATPSAKGQIAVLVTGGFHTIGMTKLLKERKVAYAVLTPRLGKVEGSGSEYLQVFKRDRTPLEKLFAGEKITLAPPLATALVQLGILSRDSSEAVRDLFVSVILELYKKTHGDVSEQDLAHWILSPARESVRVRRARQAILATIQGRTFEISSEEQAGSDTAFDLSDGNGRLVVDGLKITIRRDTTFDFSALAAKLNEAARFSGAKLQLYGTLLERWTQGAASSLVARFVARHPYASTIAAENALLTFPVFAGLAFFVLTGATGFLVPVLIALSVAWAAFALYKLARSHLYVVRGRSPRNFAHPATYEETLAILTHFAWILVLSIASAAILLHLLILIPWLEKAHPAFLVFLSQLGGYGMGLGYHEFINRIHRANGKFLLTGGSSVPTDRLQAIFSVAPALPAMQAMAAKLSGVRDQPGPQPPQWPDQQPSHWRNITDKAEFDSGMSAVLGRLRAALQAGRSNADAPRIVTEMVALGQLVRAGSWVERYLDPSLGLSELTGRCQDALYVLNLTYFLERGWCVFLNSSSDLRFDQIERFSIVKSNGRIGILSATADNTREASFLFDGSGGGIHYPYMMFYYPRFYDPGFKVYDARRELRRFLQSYGQAWDFPPGREQEFDRDRVMIEEWTHWRDHDALAVGTVDDVIRAVFGADDSVSGRIGRDLINFFANSRFTGNPIVAVAEAHAHYEQLRHAARLPDSEERMFFLYDVLADALVSIEPEYRLAAAAVVETIAQSLGIHIPEEGDLDAIHQNLVRELVENARGNRADNLWALLNREAGPASGNQPGGSFFGPAFNQEVVRPLLVRLLSLIRGAEAAPGAGLWGELLRVLDGSTPGLARDVRRLDPRTVLEDRWVGLFLPHMGIARLMKYVLERAGDAVLHGLDGAAYPFKAELSQAVRAINEELKLDIGPAGPVQVHVAEVPAGFANPDELLGYALDPQGGAAHIYISPQVIEAFQREAQDAQVPLTTLLVRAILHEVMEIKGLDHRVVESLRFSPDGLTSIPEMFAVFKRVVQKREFRLAQVMRIIDLEKADKGEVDYGNLDLGRLVGEHEARGRSGLKDLDNYLVQAQGDLQAVVELISNALDASLPPDVKPIGRFGIGAYQSLGLLKAGERLILETQTAQGPGARFIFWKKEDGEIWFDFEAPPAGSLEPGTRIELLRPMDPQAIRAIEDELRERFPVNTQGPVRWGDGSLVNHPGDYAFLDHDGLRPAQAIIGNIPVVVRATAGGISVIDHGKGMSLQGVFELFLNPNHTDKPLKGNGNGVGVFYSKEAPTPGRPARSKVAFVLSGVVIERYAVHDKLNLAPEAYFGLRYITKISYNRNSINLADAGGREPNHAYESIQEVIDWLTDPGKDIPHRFALINSLAALLRENYDKSPEGEERPLLNLLRSRVRGLLEKYGDYLFLPNDPQWAAFDGREADKIVLLDGDLIGLDEAALDRMEKRRLVEPSRDAGLAARFQGLPYRICAADLHPIAGETAPIIQAPLQGGRMLVIVDRRVLESPELRPVLELALSARGLDPSRQIREPQRQRMRSFKLGTGLLTKKRILIVLAAAAGIALLAVVIFWVAPHFSGALAGVQHWIPSAAPGQPAAQPTSGQPTPTSTPAPVGTPTSTANPSSGTGIFDFGSYPVWVQEILPWVVSPVLVLGLAFILVKAWGAYKNRPFHAHSNPNPLAAEDGYQSRTGNEDGGKTFRRDRYGTVTGRHSGPLIKAVYTHLNSDGTWAADPDLRWVPASGITGRQVAIEAEVEVVPGQTIRLMELAEGRILRLATYVTDLSGNEIAFQNHHNSLTLPADLDKQVSMTNGKVTVKVGWFIQLYDESRNLEFSERPLPAVELADFPERWAAELQEAALNSDPAAKRKAIDRILRKYFVYDQYTSLRHNGRSWGSTVREFVDKGRRIPATCDTGSLFYFLLARYVGLPAAYIAIESERGGGLFRNLDGHAQAMVRMGDQKWERVETTRLMPLRVFQPLSERPLADRWLMPALLVSGLLAVAGMNFGVNVIVHWDGPRLAAFLAVVIAGVAFWMLNWIFLTDILVRVHTRIKRSSYEGRLERLMPGQRMKSPQGVLGGYQWGTLGGRSEIYLEDPSGTTHAIATPLAKGPLTIVRAWPHLDYRGRQDGIYLIGSYLDQNKSQQSVIWTLIDGQPASLRSEPVSDSIHEIWFVNGLIFMEFKNGSYYDLWVVDRKTGALRAMAIGRSSAHKMIGHNASSVYFAHLTQESGADGRSGQYFDISEANELHSAGLRVHASRRAVPPYDGLPIQGSQYWEGGVVDGWPVFTFWAPEPEGKLDHLYSLHSDGRLTNSKDERRETEVLAEHLPSNRGETGWDRIGGDAELVILYNRTLRLLDVRVYDRKSGSPQDHFGTEELPSRIAGTGGFPAIREQDHRYQLCITEDGHLALILPQGEGYGIVPVPFDPQRPRPLSELCAQLTGLPGRVFQPYDWELRRIFEMGDYPAQQGGLFGILKQRGLPVRLNDHLVGWERSADKSGAVYGRPASPGKARFVEVNGRAIGDFDLSNWSRSERLEIGRDLRAFVALARGTFSVTESLRDRAGRSQSGIYALMNPWMDYFYRHIEPGALADISALIHRRVMRPQALRQLLDFISQIYFVLDLDKAKANAIVRTYLEIERGQPEFAEDIRRKLLAKLELPGHPEPVSPLQFLDGDPQKWQSLPYEIRFVLELLVQGMGVSLSDGREDRPDEPTSADTRGVRLVRSLEPATPASLAAAIEALGERRESELQGGAWKAVLEGALRRVGVDSSSIRGAINGHQPGMPVFVRELVHNALFRRIRSNNKERGIRINSYLSAGLGAHAGPKRWIVSVWDPTGMSLGEAVDFLMTPDVLKGDMKRLSDFFGKEFFPVFADADQVLVRTGKDGKVYEILMRPVKNETGWVMDVVLESIKEYDDPRGEFAGTEIQRIQFVPEGGLTRAYIQNAFLRFLMVKQLGAVDETIHWNGEPVADAMTKIAALGRVRSRLSGGKINRVTVGGFFIQDLGGPLLALVPAPVRQSLLELGWNLDFNENTPVIKSRDGLHHPEQYAAEAAVLALKSAARLYRQGSIQVPGLPSYADYRQLSPWSDAIPSWIREDAEKINAGEADSLAAHFAERYLGDPSHEANWARLMTLIDPAPGELSLRGEKVRDLDMPADFVAELERVNGEGVALQVHAAPPQAGEEEAFLRESRSAHLAVYAGLFLQGKVRVNGRTLQEFDFSALDREPAWIQQLFVIRLPQHRSSSLRELQAGGWTPEALQAPAQADPALAKLCAYVLEAMGLPMIDRFKSRLDDQELGGAFRAFQSGGDIKPFLARTLELLGLGIGNSAAYLDRWLARGGSLESIEQVRQRLAGAPGSDVARPDGFIANGKLARDEFDVLRSGFEKIAATQGAPIEVKLRNILQAVQDLSSLDSKSELAEKERAALKIVAQKIRATLEGSGGYTFYGIPPLVYDLEDYLLGARDGDEAFLNRDLIAYLESRGPPEMNFDLEYICHELLCTLPLQDGQVLDHYEAIALQRKLFPLHYPNPAADASYKGLLKDKLRQYIDAETAHRMEPGWERVSAPAASPRMSGRKSLPFGNYYIAAVLLLTVVVYGLVYPLFMDWGGGTGFSIILHVASSVVLLLLGFNLVNTLMTSLVGVFKKPRKLASLDLSGGVPDSLRTVVYYPILSKTEDDPSFILTKVLPSMKNNDDPNIKWVILSGSDEKLSGIERGLVSRLQEQYGPDRIFYLHRNPEVNNWEKKRGGYMHFMLWLRTSLRPDGVIQKQWRFPSMPDGKVFDMVSGDVGGLRNVRHLLIGDSDTVWPEKSVQALIARIAHPENREFTIFQGKFKISNAGESLIPSIAYFFSNAFPKRVEGQWNMLGQIAFYGHGAGWNIDEFLDKVAGRIREGFLSHDVVESSFGKTALVADVETLEEMPPNVLLLEKQWSRWWTGTKKTSVFMLDRIPDEMGRSVQNKLSLVHKYIIGSSILQFLTAPLLLLLIALGFSTHYSAVIGAISIGIVSFALFFRSIVLRKGFKNLTLSLVYLIVMFVLGPVFAYVVARFVLQSYLKDVRRMLKKKNEDVWVPQGSLPKDLNLKNVTLFSLDMMVIGALGLLSVALGGLHNVLGLFFYAALFMSPLTILLTARNPLLGTNRPVSDGAILGRPGGPDGFIRKGTEAVRKFMLVKSDFKDPDAPERETYVEGFQAKLGEIRVAIEPFLRPGSALSPKQRAALDGVAKKLAAGGYALHGIHSFVEGAEDYLLGSRDGNDVFLATDLIAYLENKSPPGTRFDLEYIAHELLCELETSQGVLTHQEAIDLQQIIFGKHQGQLRDALRGFINTVALAQRRVPDIGRLVDSAYVQEARAIHALVNPDQEAQIAIYGAAGLDVSGYLFTIGARTGYFLSDEYHFTAADLLDLKNNPDQYPEDQAYLDGKRSAGYAHISLVQRNQAMQALATELRVLGIDLRGIEVGNVSGWPSIQFHWTDPGSGKSEPYQIVFANVNLVTRNGWERLRSALGGKKADAYFQKAVMSLVDQYDAETNYINGLIAPLMSDRGYYVTDDHRSTPIIVGTGADRAELEDFAGLFPLKDQVRQVHVPNGSTLDLGIQQVQGHDPKGYGWQLRIRKVLRERVSDTARQLRDIIHQDGTAAPIILGIGFGDGADEMWLAHQAPGSHVLAFSPVRDEVRAADDAQRGPNRVAFYVGDATDRSFKNPDGTDMPDHSVDYVYARLSLHYLDRQQLEAAFREMHRVLKPGGKIVIVVKSQDDKWYHDETATTDETTRMTRYRQGGKLLDRQFFNAATLREYAEQAGFRAAPDAIVPSREILWKFGDSEPSSLLTLVATRENMGSGAAQAFPSPSLRLDDVPAEDLGRFGSYVEHYRAVKSRTLDFPGFLIVDRSLLEQERDQARGGGVRAEIRSGEYFEILIMTYRDGSRQVLVANKSREVPINRDTIWGQRRELNDLNGDLLPAKMSTSERESLILLLMFQANRLKLAALKGHPVTIGDIIEASFLESQRAFNERAEALLQPTNIGPDGHPRYPREGYNLAAKLYSHIRHFSWIYAVIIVLMKGMLSSLPSDRKITVLDDGTGFGHFVLTASHLLPGDLARIQFIGTDQQTQDMERAGKLAAAERPGLQVAWAQEDIARPGHARRLRELNHGERVDLMAINHVLEHLDGRPAESFIEEWLSAAKVLVVSVPLGDGLDSTVSSHTQEFSAARLREIARTIEERRPRIKADEGLAAWGVLIFKDTEPDEPWPEDATRYEPAALSQVGRSPAAASWFENHFYKYRVAWLLETGLVLALSLGLSVFLQNSGVGQSINALSALLISTVAVALVAAVAFLLPHRFHNPEALSGPRARILAVWMGVAAAVVNLAIVMPALFALPAGAIFLIGGGGVVLWISGGLLHRVWNNATFERELSSELETLNRLMDRPEGISTNPHRAFRDFLLERNGALELLGAGRRLLTPAVLRDHDGEFANLLAGLTAMLYLRDAGGLQLTDEQARRIKDLLPDLIERYAQSQLPKGKVQMEPLPALDLSQTSQISQAVSNQFRIVYSHSGKTGSAEVKVLQDKLLQALRQFVPAGQVALRAEALETLFTSGRWVVMNVSGLDPSLGDTADMREKVRGLLERMGPEAQLFIIGSEGGRQAFGNIPNPNGVRVRFSSTRYAASGRAQLRNIHEDLTRAGILRERERATVDILVLREGDIEIGGFENPDIVFRILQLLPDLKAQETLESFGNRLIHSIAIIEEQA